LIIAVSGTGTGVGKTTVSTALLRTLREHTRVTAYKPIETGGDADGRALAEASGSQAGPTVVLQTPVAPNVAARAEGVVLDPGALAQEARRRSVDSVLVLETAGGLFSPMTDDETNADWLDRVAPDLLVLVASNRLGVLHDVEACRRASKRTIDCVVLTGAAPDASVATNRLEIVRRLPVVEMKSPDDVGELAEWASRVCHVKQRIPGR
jgi:dethiobiotin synthase